MIANVHAANAATSNAATTNAATTNSIANAATTISTNANVADTITITHTTQSTTQIIPQRSNKLDCLDTLILLLDTLERHDSTETDNTLSLPSLSVSTVVSLQ